MCTLEYHMNYISVIHNSQYLFYKYHIPIIKKISIPEAILEYLHLTGENNGIYAAILFRSSLDCKRVLILKSRNLTKNKQSYSNKYYYYYLTFDIT